MVLKRVGERVVDVLVNGNQQASYTQTAERADYDVSVSDNSETKVFRHTGNGNTNTRYFFARSNGTYADSDGDIRVSATDPEGSGDISLQVFDGSSIIEDITLSPSGTTAWYSYSEFEWIRAYDSSGDGSVDFEVEIRRSVQSGYSIDGVTQS